MNQLYNNLAMYSLITYQSLHKIQITLFMQTTLVLDSIANMSILYSPSSVVSCPR